MSDSNQTSLTLLPHLAPDTFVSRLLLYTMRRMAVGGLHDAHASSALMGTFGLNHKRVQMFLRVFMAELARSSSRTITMAPCCCRRMTAHEDALVRIITSAGDQPKAMHAELSALLGTPDARAPLAAAIGLSDVLTDLGRPLAYDRALSAG